MKFLGNWTAHRPVNRCDYLNAISWKKIDDSCRLNLMGCTAGGNQMLIAGISDRGGRIIGRNRTPAVFYASTMRECRAISPARGVWHHHLPAPPYQDLGKSTGDPPVLLFLSSLPPFECDADDILPSDSISLT